MRSYHNDAAIKEKFQLRFAAHREADKVIQGTGYDSKGRGCFVGCTLQNYDHSQFPIELGWPEWLARLADRIFEGLPKSEAPQFGTDLLAAVPIGVDLEPVKFMIAIERHGRLLKLLEGDAEPYAEQVRQAIHGVTAYCRAELDGSYKDKDAAAARAAAAADACAYAARAAYAAARAAAAACADAAYDAAYAAAYAAAADAAAYAAYAAACGAAAYSYETAIQQERDVLLAVLRNLK